MEIRIVNGIPYGSTDTITVSGGSPFTWQNPEASRVVVMISGGVLNTVQLSSDGTTFVDVGLACGQYFLNPNWKIKVGYTITPPSMSYTPG